MFDELKKLKKLLQNEKLDMVPQKVSANRPVVLPPLLMTKCPACDRTFPNISLKKHLVREHGVTERIPLSQAIEMLSRGKASTQQIDGERPKLKPQAAEQKQFRPLNPNKGSAKQELKKGQQRQRIDDLDRSKNLDGYTEKTIRLPSGENHQVFVRHTKPSMNSAPAQPIRISAKSGKSPSSGQRSGQTPTLVPKVAIPPTKRSFRLSTSDEFKVPDGWVANGIQTTLHPGGSPFPVFMGIDFGTAFTKASIGYGDDIYIVDWEGINNGTEQFTLPGEFSELPDGSCVIGRAPNATRVGTDLKIPFIEGNASRSALIDATVFLSLIMRYIRGWWFHHHKGIIQNKAIEWYVNLGAPTTPWHDGYIRQRYEKAAKAAWAMSCNDHDITADQTERILKNESITAPPIEIVPEFVAQIACYTRSPQRQPDLHLLVDVGAGTVDTVTFNVHRDDQTGEDRFPIFWASVSNLGTHYLMSRRLHSFPEIRDDHWRDASTVPNAREFSKTSGIPVQDVGEADRLHTREVALAISSVLRTTKQKRYRKSPNWTAGVRVFFCGGGSSCEAFAQSISLASKLSGVPLARLRLPLPSRLKAPSLPASHFHRVSVAYGLGMNVWNLGEIRTIAQVEDDTPVYLPSRQHNANSDYRG